MALELKQQIKLAQQLVMTPQLRQAIKLLQLSRLELVETLSREVEQNPLLDVVETSGDNDLDASPESQPITDEAASQKLEKTAEINMESSSSMAEINWDDYTNYYDSGFSFSRETPDTDRPTRLDFLSQKPNLQTYMQWQISHINLTDEEKMVVPFILGNLNRHGFLDVTVEDISREIGCEINFADRIVSIVQGLDPPGVAARNVKESLLLQLTRLDLDDSLAAIIVRDHLHTLEIKNYGAIAKATKRPIKEVQAAIAIITGLNPYPGRLYSDEETQYITPDVYVYKIGDQYLIVLNDEGMPRLRVSPVYQEILQNESKVPTDTKNYLKNKLKDAVWLIKSIQQRQRTIYKVVESLLKFQKAFFEKGVSHLKPLILKDVAEDISMHESTVSRVTSNKYVHTPQGIFELKYFFSTAIQQKGGEDLAAESIRQRIRSMIQTEDPQKPLTDIIISNIFASENIKVARRTVAKYREQLGILPVKLRRLPKLGK